VVQLEPRDDDALSLHRRAEPEVVTDHRVGQPFSYTPTIDRNDRSVGGLTPMSELVCCRRGVALEKCRRAVGQLIGIDVVDVPRLAKCRRNGSFYLHRFLRRKTG